MSHVAKVVFLLKCLDVKNGVSEKRIAFFVCLFCVGDRETEKRKNTKFEKAQKNYKNSVFQGGHPKLKNGTNGS